MFERIYVSDLLKVAEDAKQRNISELELYTNTGDVQLICPVRDVSYILPKVRNSDAPTTAVEVNVLTKVFI